MNRYDERYLSLIVLPGENKLEVLKRVEQDYGLSMSKMSPEVYKLQKNDISYPSKDSSTKKQFVGQRKYKIALKRLNCASNHPK